MAKLDITELTLAVDRMLEVTEDPLHRQILENYRRHSLLVVSGRWQELFTAEMTVEHPVYRMTERGRTIVLDGLEAVRSFYRGLEAAGNLVLMLEDEQLAVADWGLASEAIFNHYVPGRVLAAAGDDVEDLDSCHLLRYRAAVIWRHDDRGRMIGEHVYEETASREVVALASEEVITLEAARAALTPLIRPLPRFEGRVGVGT